MPEYDDHEFVRRINLALLTGAANLDSKHLAAITGLPPGVVTNVLTHLEVDNLPRGGGATASGTTDSPPPGSGARTTRSTSNSSRPLPKPLRPRP
ncbi:MAG: hypothetical protein ACRDNL_10900 [Spirillospora sp.]